MQKIGLSLRHPTHREYPEQVVNGRNQMFDLLRKIWKLLGLSGNAERRRLLRKYPSHLDLIDSREIPHEYSTGPDLSYFTESARFYYDLIIESAPHLKDKTRPLTDADREMASNAYNRIVNASWGLIECGAESVPFAIQLIRSSDRDHREAASNVFCGLRDSQRLSSTLEAIYSALEDEPDQLVVDSLLCALGNLRSRDSIPVLARYIWDDSVDGDTRDTAANSLGQVVRKRFDKSNIGAIDAACQWLTANGYTRP